MLLSIIIPAFNEEKQIGQTIAHLERSLQGSQYPNLSWEIIVCDNNSTDSTARLAADHGAKVVFEPHNQIAQARNRGAGLAEGQWLLFLDADTYPPGDLIAEMLSTFACDEYIGGGSTILVEGGSLFNKLRMERLNPLYRLFNWCGGAFLFCRQAAFQTVDGFCTDLYALEDVDFVFRLKRLGRKRAQAFALFHRSPAKVLGRQAAYPLFDIVSIIFSDIAAVFLFGLHYLLPKPWRSKVGGRKLLRYWYAHRAET